MIDHIDHIVLTTRDLDGCIRFYSEVLGMKLEKFAQGRLALKFGKQKINLHEWGKEFEPRAHVAVPGRSIFASSLRFPWKKSSRGSARGKSRFWKGR